MLQNFLFMPLEFGRETFCEISTWELEETVGG
jgi:hypothetical protein